MFSNYNNYLDWFSGAFQHIFMGTLIQKNLIQGKWKIVKDLLIFEAFYDSIVYFSVFLFYFEKWKNNQHNSDDYIRFFFNTIHF